MVGSKMPLDCRYDGSADELRGCTRARSLFAIGKLTCEVHFEWIFVFTLNEVKYGHAVQALNWVSQIPVEEYQTSCSPKDVDYWILLYAELWNFSQWSALFCTDARIMMWSHSRGCSLLLDNLSWAMIFNAATFYRAAIFWALPSEMVELRRSTLKLRWIILFPLSCSWPKSFQGWPSTNSQSSSCFTPTCHWFTSRLWSKFYYALTMLWSRQVSSELHADSSWPRRSF